MTIMDVQTKEVLAPDEVPSVLVCDTESFAAFQRSIGSSVLVAADTETYGWGGGFEGHMRVLTVCTVDARGTEEGFIFDTLDFASGAVNKLELAKTLSGVECIGWNANFDARVTERALFDGTGIPPIKWWDAMLADAMLYQGRLGFTWYHGLAAATFRDQGFTMSGKGSTQTSFTESDPLSQEQLRYAVVDAIVTAREAVILRERLHAAGLVQKASLVMGAREFLDHMERNGIPVDWPAWQDHLDGLKTRKAELRGELAQMTGGGQGNLFSAIAEPTWNVNSQDDVRDVLNRFATQEVSAFFAATAGSARLFSKTDSVNKDALMQVGGDIATTLLEYRNTEKLLSTYGDSLEKWIGPDGRFHSQYLMEVGTDTGRLSSRNPNAQNFTPKLKAFFRNDRVFAYADLSQAELRTLAEITGDEAMLDAFRSGVDIHEATASRLFNVDMAELKASSPKEFKEFRSKAKTLNFGIVYGLGAKALALRLSLSGVPTTPEEAKGLLAAYLGSYPQIAAWLAERDSFVRNFSRRAGDVDLKATLLLRDLQPVVSAKVKAMAKASGSVPTDMAVTEEVYSAADVKAELEAKLEREVTPDELEAEFKVRCSEVAWARTFGFPAVLNRRGEAITFDSRTKIGSRRVFELATDSLLLEMCLQSLRKMTPGDKVAAFCDEHNCTFFENKSLVQRERLLKTFEDRQLRRDWVDFLVAAKGDIYGTQLAKAALSDRVGALANAYRNHPVQGGVADVALAAYAKLVDVLKDFPTAVPCQTVHDSIILECDEADAPALALALKEAMESAMSEIYPGVPARADADIRRSFDDNDVIEELANLV
jgi:DNA polymerase I-like protein with 3'-5' exonuclease and polymerase domains